MAAGRIGTEIASHRGGAILWPENSLLAFRQALSLPAEQLEIDVHLTADGEVAVIHDATLDRTTDGTGPVRAQPMAALRRLRLKGTDGEGVPGLAEVVALVKQAGRVLRLEIKADGTGRPYPGLVPACLAVLDAGGIRGRTVLMSFEPMTVAAAAAAGGFQRLVLLMGSRPWHGMGPEGAIALARACHAEELGLTIADWDEASVAALRDAGLGVSAWGTNDESSIRRGFALGMDAIATDDPPLALRLRG
ncbi:glycerophosphodiester phosphodiesterase family protein [Belnapia sp. F-4-1]|uniref:glycerophosphodiester phosphodiesterase n=1 Tax=Belnapia sp. F-4-1 TaxID=1545443 RepID=UPI00068FDE55|nr:glycerophosphodiester phosphodiesterase family protein [Belnapia sp. F-4-1]